jgi:hypothetical protein
MHDRIIEREIAQLEAAGGSMKGFFNLRNRQIKKGRD